MLVGLSIRNIVLIETLSLTFGPGLWALTGETGAGKSILLDALGLAVGERAGRRLVRSGAAEGMVTAVFRPPPDHPVWAALSEQGLPAEEDLILRRAVTADGRSRAFVNDQPVSIAALRRFGELVLEVTGQHEERGLLSPASHRATLDLFGGLADLSEQVAAAHDAWQDGLARLHALRSRIAQAEADEAYLRHALEELEALDPCEGEEDRLARDRARLMQAETVAADLTEAERLLEGQASLEHQLNAVLRRLEAAARHAPDGLDPVVSALDRALVEVNEAALLVRQAGRDLDLDQGRLEALEERLFALRAAARKHKVPVDRLAALRDDFARQLLQIETGHNDQAVLEAEVDALRRAYLAAAHDLSQRRRSAARRLDKAVNKELKPLKMDKARFCTRMESLPEEKSGRSGLDRVRFEIATTPGASPGPMTQITSGGELARLILALKVSLAGAGSAGTLIFDEVDRGVGGAVAAAVGERLARLAEQAQVLVVTHSPQVAARADHHLHVTKSGKGKHTFTRVTHLSASERQEEIARMLSAATITDEARAAAVSLLNISRSRALKTGTAG